MADQYPKSREELLVENDQLRQKIAGLETFSRSQEQELAAKDRTIEVLKRRTPPRVLDPGAGDRFQRPYRG